MLNEIDIHMLERYIEKNDVTGYTNLRRILTTTVAQMVNTPKTKTNPHKEARLAVLSELTPREYMTKASAKAQGFYPLSDYDQSWIASIGKLAGMTNSVNLKGEDKVFAQVNGNTTFTGIYIHAETFERAGLLD